jgi:hypothetical protein
MASITREPTVEEVQFHSDTHPFSFKVGKVRPEFVGVYSLQGYEKGLSGGVWYLRTDKEIIAAPLTAHGDLGVLYWKYEFEYGGYMPHVLPKGIILAESLDGLTGRTTSW